MMGTRRRCLIAPFLVALAATGTAGADDFVTIQADKLVYSRPDSSVTARGNVVVTFDQGYAQGNSAAYDLARRRIYSPAPITFRTDGYEGTATSATLDPDSSTGLFYGATITGRDGTLIWGERIAQTGEHTFRVERGGFTPCSCPETSHPAWSVHVASATVEWRRRVRFRGARFNARRVPLLYAPAGILPLPESRQTGLLFPRLGWDRALGWRVRPGAFVAMGDHADATLWLDYASKAGAGPLGELRGVSRTGTYSIGGSWFREFRDAEVLYENGAKTRSASTRWDTSAQIEQHIPGELQLNVGGRIVSDQLRDRDFATDLASLTRSSSDSRLQLYGTWPGPGAALARVGISQALIGSGASGARIPSLRWLPDPVAFGGWPVRLRSSLRYDRIVQQDAGLGDIWQPDAWLPTADRVIAQAALGAIVDPLPGLFIDADLGGIGIVRNAREWQVATTSPYSVTASNLPGQIIAAGYATVRNELRLQSVYRNTVQRLHAGTDLNWLRPSETVASPIEQIDRLRWQTWIVPHIDWRAAVSDATLWWRLDTPIRYDAGAQPADILAQQAAVGAGPFNLRARLWRNWATATWPLAEATVGGGPWKGQRLTLGVARRTTDTTTAAWDVPRGQLEAPQPVVGTPYREAWLRWDWEIWRFRGTLEARRRFPLYPGEASAWNSQRINLGYHDPCDCLQIGFGWQNLPGDRGDRVDIRIDFALLGGVGTDDGF